MKLIIIDKKKTGVFIIIVGLMLVLFCLGINFEERLKFTSLVRSNIKSLSVYTVDGKDITYKLPGEWTTHQEKFSGGELIYNNGFVSNKGDIHGYVNVWNLRDDLKTFIGQEKVVSESQNYISGYRLENFHKDDSDGFKTTYNMKAKSGEQYIVYEYFIKYDEVFVNFDFYIKENDFNENMEMNLETIVKTAQIERKN